MPQTIFTITNARLQPAQYPSDARKSNGQFGANQTFFPGSVIGRKTSDSKLYPSVVLSAVYTATPTGTATAGTFTISVVNSTGALTATTALAYNASIATIQTALDIASGVVNGIVASSSGSAAPFSTPTALILTYSGTGFANTDQPKPVYDISQLIDTTALVTVATIPNDVQTLTPTGTASAGTFEISIMRPTGIWGETGPIAFGASIATIQTALDLASGVANGVVASSAATSAPWSTPTPLILTFSGTGYAGLPQQLVTYTPNGMTGQTVVTVADTTLTNDGTQIPVGFAEFGFKTDANGVCYLNTTTAGPDIMELGTATMPFYTSGTFLTADLVGWNGGMLAMLGGRTLAAGLIRIP